MKKREILPTGKYEIFGSKNAHTVLNGSYYEKTVKIAFNYQVMAREMICLDCKKEKGKLGNGDYVLLRIGNDYDAYPTSNQLAEAIIWHREDDEGGKYKDHKNYSMVFEDAKSRKIVKEFKTD